jgi:hypothetical protein
MEDVTVKMTLGCVEMDRRDALSLPACSAPCVGCGSCLYRYQKDHLASKRHFYLGSPQRSRPDALPSHIRRKTIRRCSVVSGLRGEATWLTTEYGR